MTLHGETTIQLFDAHTGRLVEEHHDTNMVTHAIRDLLAMDPLGMRNLNAMSSVFPIMPLCPNAIGGILLFPSTLTEDADQYYAPPANVPTGYAAAESYTGSDPKRGQYNASESAQIANGYRFVFDWPTDRGNGTISALGLTSLRGGRSWYGSMYDRTKSTYPWWSDSRFAGDRQTYGGSSSSDPASTSNPWDAPRGWQNDTAFSATIPTMGTTQSGTPTTTPVNWITRRLPASTLGLNQTAKVGDATTTQLLLNGNYYRQWSGGKQYADYSWDHDKCYVWAYAGNSSGSATIRLATINAGTVAERTLTVSAQLAGYDTGTLLGCAVISNGHMYAWNHALNGVYRISLTDETDVTLLPLPDGYGTPSKRPFMMLNPYGDGMIPAGYYDGTSRGFLICDTTIIGIDYYYYYYYYYSFSSSSYLYYSPVHAWGPYQLIACGDREYKGLGLKIRTPYLATINNLSSSVTKTTAQTMKITYTITES